VRAQERFFRRSAAEELGRRFEPGECEWSFDRLYADVLRAMKLAGRARRGHYPRGADALTARVIDIVRRERRRPERIREWEREQKRQSDG
jgi:hypothetical protein